MILGAEVGITIYGLYALFTGKYSLGKGKVIEGQPARIAGLFLALTIPLAFFFGLIIAIIFGDVGLVAVIADIAAIAICAILATWYAKKNAPTEENIISLEE